MSRTPSASRAAGDSAIRARDLVRVGAGMGRLAVGHRARIANAAANSSRSAVGRKGGRNGSYDDWSKQDLVKRAREIGIKGRSTMTKAELTKALRDH